MQTQVKQGKGTTEHLMPLGDWFNFTHSFLHSSTHLFIHSFLGSGSDRGRSPVEWGDLPFLRPSIHPPSGPLSQA